MKKICFIGAASLLALTGCSTTHNPDAKNASAKKDPAEPVIVMYHVQLGREAQFQALLAQAWKVYQSEHMVFSSPHLIVRRSEDMGRTQFVEIFTWKAAPDNPPKSVKDIWQQEQAMCEARGGHTGIEGGVVQIVTQK